jgi:hypothetical protein
MPKLSLVDPKDGVDPSLFDLCCTFCRKGTPRVCIVSPTRQSYSECSNLDCGARWSLAGQLLQWPHDVT